jgi:uncharacterized protein with HEPN domain
MQDKTGNRARILHILDAIEEIEFYNSNVDFEKFCKTSIIRFASIKQIEIIGEAANYISQKVKDEHQEIPWKRIIGLRNILIHEYFGVDAKLIWDIIQFDLPELKINILRVLDGLGD